MTSVRSAPTPPTPDPALQEITRIATQADVKTIPGFPTINSTSTDEQQLLMNFQSLEEEMTDDAKAALKELDPWTSTLRTSSNYAYLKRQLTSICFKNTQHAGLSAEENSRVHVLLQLANFQYFLHLVETTAEDGDDKDAITNLRTGITKTVSVLRFYLLPGVDSDTISSLVLTDVDGHVMSSLQNVKTSVRWVVCYAGLEIMVQTFENIRVSLESRSIIMTESS